MPPVQGEFMTRGVGYLEKVVAEARLESDLRSIEEAVSDGAQRGVSMNDLAMPTARMWLTDSRVYNLVWLGRWIERAHAVCRSVEVAAASSDPQAIPRAAACWGIENEGNGVSLAYF
jgi:hypothetical protein